MSIIAKFDEDNGFKSYKVVEDDPGYGEYAMVEKAEGDLFVVVVDYRDYDSVSSRDVATFIDAFSDIEKAETLAVEIHKIMSTTLNQDFGSYKERGSLGFDYTTDVGNTRRCGLGRFFGWGSTYKNVAIVRAHKQNKKREGVEYR